MAQEHNRNERVEERFSREVAALTGVTDALPPSLQPQEYDMTEYEGWRVSDE